MKREETTRRVRERLGLAMPMQVRGFDGIGHEWSEISQLVDATPFGARLRLSRPTEPGRLLHVSLVMPRSLRCFDHAEDQYRVWCLVRNVELLKESETSSVLLEAGVAFIGKHPPASFAQDPVQRYQLAQDRKASGLYELTEDSDDLVVEVEQKDKRRVTRHTIPMEVAIEVFGKDGDQTLRENTVTENISRKGAAVFTSLGIERGRFVRITSEHHGVSAIASVHARHTGQDGVSRLHLEFVGAEWPLGGIE